MKRRYIILSSCILLLFLIIGLIFSYNGKKKRVDVLNNNYTNEENNSSTYNNNEDNRIKDKDMYAFKTEYGDDFVVFSKYEDDAFGQGTWSYTLSFRGKKICHFSSKKEKLEAVPIYKDKTIRAYKYGRFVFYSLNNDGNFIILQNDEYNETIKSILKALLKKGYINESEQLFKKNDDTSIKILKQYADGDFSTLEHGYVSESEVQMQAKCFVKIYGL